MKTYNNYVQGEALKQTTNNAITVYKVRKPKKGEEVIGYTNLSEALVKPTYTEEALIEAEEGGTII